MNKGEIIRLAIRDLNNLGCGVGLAEDGRAVFVKGAVTSDVVESEIIKVNKSYAVGRLLRVIEPSPHRVERDACVAPASCGGCVYRKITYEYEKEIKRGYVASSFRRAALPDVTVLPTLSVGEAYGYRNKAQYPLTATRDGVRAGFYATKTHKVVPCEECAIQNSVFGRVVDLICKYATKVGWSVYDEQTGKGLLRHIYLRIGEKTEEILVTLVVNGKALPQSDGLVEKIRAAFPQTVGILLNVNEQNTNVVLGKTFVTLWGRDYMEDELCGLRFRLSPDAFYQVNRKGAELLYGKAVELADLRGDELLMDLYCGTGTIGLCMARSVRRVVGVEIVPSAVECARENAARNGVENAEFFCADASCAENILAASGGKCPDVVVLDPPRKGCSRELIACLANNLSVPKIVYVSCDPDTLARDCAYFAELGYAMGDVQPVDMFPRTGHVESVVCLTRKN